MPPVWEALSLICMLLYPVNKYMEMQSIEVCQEITVVHPCVLSQQFFVMRISEFSMGSNIYLFAQPANFGKFCKEARLYIKYRKYWHSIKIFFKFSIRMTVQISDTTPSFRVDNSFPKLLVRSCSEPLHRLHQELSKKYRSRNFIRKKIFNGFEINFPFYRYMTTRENVIEQIDPLIDSLCQFVDSRGVSILFSCVVHGR